MFHVPEKPLNQGTAAETIKKGTQEPFHEPLCSCAILISAYLSLKDSLFFVFFAAIRNILHVGYALGEKNS